MTKKYSAIICTQDGDEAARFSKLTAPELMKKIDAAIEVGSFAIVDEAVKEDETGREIRLDGEPYIIDNRGVV